jgi:hypothetical protein
MTPHYKQINQAEYIGTWKFIGPVDIYLYQKNGLIASFGDTPSAQHHFTINHLLMSNGKTEWISFLCEVILNYQRKKKLEQI